MENDELKPVSIWTYVGLFFLSAIPCVGLIATIVFACGAVKNKNIINYARAQLIVVGIVLALYLLLLMLGLGAGILGGMSSALSGSSGYYY